MTDSWSERARAYRESTAHREGPDLDLGRTLGKGGENAARDIGEQTDSMERDDALDGNIQSVANRVFLLTPRDVEVSAEERKRIAERAFFNQL